MCVMYAVTIFISLNNKRKIPTPKNIVYNKMVNFINKSYLHFVYFSFVTFNIRNTLNHILQIKHNYVFHIKTFNVFVIVYQ